MLSYFHFISNIFKYVFYSYFRYVKIFEVPSVSYRLNKNNKKADNNERKKKRIIRLSILNRRKTKIA